MPRQRKPDFIPDDNESIGLLILIWGFVAVVVLLGKGVPFTLLYALYNNSINLGDSIYLEELPLMGSLIAKLDPDLTARNLLAMMLAAFSVLVPAALWTAIFELKINENPGEFLSSPDFSPH